MEENKNIDKFFKDRLEVDNAPEWATPSDDIWMSAKSRFNKKKKRKKRFVFWLLSSGLAIISLVSIVAIIYNEKNVKVERNQLTNKVEQFENKQFENPEIKEANRVDVSDAPSNKEIVSTNQSNQNKSGELVSNESFRINNTELRIDKKEEEQTKLVVDSNIKTNNRSLKNSPRILDEFEAKKQEFLTNRLLSNDIVSDEEPTRIILPVKLDLDAAIVDKTLPVLGILPSEEHALKLPISERDNSSLMAGLFMLASPLDIDRPKYELGLSHSKYLISAFLKSEEIDDEEAELNNIKMSLKNINITGRKWISKKWSYSIGANLTQLKVNTDIELLDTLDRNLNNFINDNYTISRSNLKSDIPDIGLIDGVELMTGDILNVKGNVDLSLVAVQIPIMLDYHIYKNKMEYLFGSGFSADFLQVTQGEIDISIFKDQQLVNKPFVQERISEFVLDYSIYANLGMKYHIHKNWNVGLSMKISVLEPVFSYAELGVYYRWHK